MSSNNFYKKRLPSAPPKTVRSKSQPNPEIASSPSNQSQRDQREPLSSSNEHQLLPSQPLQGDLGTPSLQGSSNNNGTSFHQSYTTPIESITSRDGNYSTPPNESFWNITSQGSLSSMLFC